MVVTVNITYKYCDLFYSKSSAASLLLGFHSDLLTAQDMYKTQQYSKTRTFYLTVTWLLV